MSCNPPLISISQLSHDNSTASQQDQEPSSGVIILVRFPNFLVHREAGPRPDQRHDQGYALRPGPVRRERDERGQLQGDPEPRAAESLHVLHLQGLSKKPILTAGFDVFINFRFDSLTVLPRSPSSRSLPRLPWSC